MMWLNINGPGEMFQGTGAGDGAGAEAGNTRDGDGDVHLFGF